MADVLLFHHAHGLTEGVVAFADELRAAGHVVHAPDLYDGHVFADLDEGVAYAKSVGFDVIGERGAAAAQGLPAGLVFAGFSLGALPAQMLAQTRPGAKGALLCSAAFPAAEFGAGWPDGVALQIHMMEGDPWAEEDLPAARDLVASVDGAELVPLHGGRPPLRRPQPRRLRPGRGPPSHRARPGLPRRGVLARAARPARRRPAVLEWSVA